MSSKIVTVSTIVGIAVGGIGIYQFFTTPSADLRAELMVTPYPENPLLAEVTDGATIKEIVEDATSALEHIYPNGISSPEVEGVQTAEHENLEPYQSSWESAKTKIKKEYARSIEHVLGDKLIATESLDRIWTATISNSGDARAEDVVVTLGGARLAVINRPGEADEKRQVDEVIRIGALRPQESINITAWASWPRPEGYSVVYSEGIADVDFLRPVGGILGWIDKYWAGIEAILFFFVAPIVMVIIVVALLKVFSSRPQESTSDSDSPTQDN